MKKSKKEKVDLTQNQALERKFETDSSKNGYNFVGNLNNWTSIEEQKIKVDEIEKKTKGT